MTTDTKAIRAQMEALEGFTPGPWYQANGSEIHDRSVMFGESGERLGSTPMLIAEAYSPREEGNARLIAAAPDMHATILALCDALDEMRADNERLREVLKGMDLEAQRETVETLLKPTLIHLVMKMSDDARAALAQKGGE